MNLMSSSMVVELDVYFIGFISYFGSVFALEEPSSNQVNRPQDPIRAPLSIALQLTSSIHSEDA